MFCELSVLCYLTGWIWTCWTCSSLPEGRWRSPYWLSLPRSCSGLQLSLKFITGKCWRDLSLHFISQSPRSYWASEEEHVQMTWIFSTDILSHFSILTLVISYSAAGKWEKIYTLFILKALSIQSVTVTQTTGSKPQDKVATCYFCVISSTKHKKIL